MPKQQKTKKTSIKPSQRFLEASKSVQNKMGARFIPHVGVNQS